MNTVNEYDRKKVRVILDIDKYPAYKKSPYTIPIYGDGGRFRTGQSLDTSKIISGKMKGNEPSLIPAPLTEEEKAKYPIIIDPTNHYKVRNLQWLFKDDDMDKALINLMLISGYWAENRAIYEINPVKYHGYFDDPITEAVIKNDIKKERYEAETEVRYASNSDYERIALIFNFSVPESNININDPSDILKGKLIDYCETHPKQMKMCFEKYNKGIDKDIFILECINADIINRKPSGDLYHDREYIGVSMEDCHKYMAKKGNEPLYAKFKSLLEIKSGKKVSDYVVETVEKTDDNISYIMKCKSSIFDGDYEGAKRNFSKIDKEAYKSECERLEVEIENLKGQRVNSKLKAEINAFETELNDLPLAELHNKILHIKSNYKESECKDFWNDKAKLVDYMLKVKFKNK
jgi:hypothetical protein